MLGMVFGAGAGVVLGGATGEWGVWLPIGIAVGLAIGIAVAWGSQGKRPPGPPR
jgi:hypothetical protein